MADIEADRAWMRQHAANQRREEDERWQREVAEAAQTCSYCFHEKHQIEWGSSSWSGLPGDPWVQSAPTSVSVLWCGDEICLCGVEPCSACGHRARHHSENLEAICGACGHRWHVAVYA